MTQRRTVGVRALLGMLMDLAFSARAAQLQVDRARRSGEEVELGSLADRLASVARIAMDLMHVFDGGGALSMQLRAA